jgi:hypothetical protein
MAVSRSSRTKAATIAAMVVRAGFALATFI